MYRNGRETISHYLAETKISAEQVYIVLTHLTVILIRSEKFSRYIQISPTFNPHSIQIQNMRSSRRPLSPLCIRLPRYHRTFSIIAMLAVSVER